MPTERSEPQGDWPPILVSGNEAQRMRDGDGYLDADLLTEVHRYVPASEPQGDTTAAYIYRVEIGGLENLKALYFGPEVSVDLEWIADAWRKTGAHVTRYVPASEPPRLSEEDRKRLREIADVIGGVGVRANHEIVAHLHEADARFLRNLANQQQGGTDA